jgi:hypothetical protein
MNLQAQDNLEVVSQLEVLVPMPEVSPISLVLAPSQYGLDLFLVVSLSYGDLVTV